MLQLQSYRERIAPHQIQLEWCIKEYNFGSWARVIKQNSFATKTLYKVHELYFWGDSSIALAGICFTETIALIRKTNLFIAHSGASRLFFICCYVQYLENEILSYRMSREEIVKISRNESYKSELNRTVSTQWAARVILFFLYLMEQLCHVRCCLNRPMLFFSRLCKSLYYFPPEWKRNKIISIVLWF